MLRSVRLDSRAAERNHLRVSRARFVTAVRPLGLVVGRSAARKRHVAVVGARPLDRRGGRGSGTATIPYAGGPARSTFGWARPGVGAEAAFPVADAETAASAIRTAKAAPRD